MVPPRKWPSAKRLRASIGRRQGLSDGNAHWAAEAEQRQLVMDGRQRVRLQTLFGR